MSQADSDAAGAILAGKPVSDLTWSLPSMPSGWHDLGATAAGEVQLQTAPTCVLYFQQPNGLNADPSLTAPQVAAKTATLVLQQSVGVTVTPAPAADTSLAAVVSGTSIRTTASFAAVDFVDDTGQYQGRTLAYRSDDYALIVTALCGKGAWGSAGSAMLRYVESATVKITF